MKSSVLKLRKKVFILKVILISLIFITANYAQSAGSISGRIIDGETGGGLIGANVVVEGSLLGAAGDIEGDYLISKIPAGKYNLIFSMIGYSKKIVTGVEVFSGKATKLNIVLDVETYETEEVIVTAKAVRNTEASLLSKRQKSISVGDAIGSEQFLRSGAGNAADAVRQVVGASVVDGKYVYVRGLGDRYTNTQLNGAEIPSIDPYKRSGSIDIIPAGLIDNIQTVKSFTPDKPGNFSGGSVDITTKDFPDKFNAAFSVKSSFDSEITFNPDGLGTSSGSTDWLGFDDGGRSIPSIIGGETWLAKTGEAQRDENKAKKIDEVTKAFSGEMSPVNRPSSLNYNYSLSIGNQIPLFNRPFGFIASLSYKKNNGGYINGRLNRWARGVADPNKTELDTTFAMSDSKSYSEVLWGGMLKLSYKLNQFNKISLNGLFNQNGVSSAQYVAGSYPYDIDPEWTFEARSIGYKERSLGSVQINGEHMIAELFNAKIDWKAAFISSRQNEPDLRFFYDYYTPKNVYGIKSNLAPERYFRKTSEKQKDFQFNISLPFKVWGNRKETIKFGGKYSDKKRSFIERRFVYSPASRIGSSFREVNGNVNSLFNSNNIGWVKTDTLSNGMTLNRIPIYIQETDQTSSDYDGRNIIRAAYVMTDLQLLNDLRVILGARYENTSMNVLSKDPNQINGRIETNNVLPSLNLVYSPVDNMNIRFAYGRTLARPTFREISPFTNYDFNGGDTYVGNPDLNITLINNYDLRWEWFSKPGEVFAVSFFFKDFSNPIELKIHDAVNNVLTWVNVPRAAVRGIEFEIRRNLSAVYDVLKNFTVGSNFSYIQSFVDIDSEELASIKVYDSNASGTRQFQGQSPFIVNFYLNYDNPAQGWNANLYYNVFGKRLSAVGSVGSPDVYEKPFNMLNLSISKKIMQNISIKISAANILNSSVVKVQEFKGQEYIYQSYRRGSSVSAEIKYNL